MKKTFIAILALVAGLAGLAIGMAASRVAHHATLAPSSHDRAAYLPPAKSDQSDPTHTSEAAAHKAASGVAGEPDAPAPAAGSASPEMTTMIGDDDDVIRFAKNPQPVPPFLLQDLDGNAVSTAQWQGKVVILNFWATWCPPCRDEIPLLVELAKKYKDGLQIVGVSLDDSSADDVRQFAKAFHVNYPIVMGSRELLSEYGGVPALPTTFLINKDSRVVLKHEGLYPPEVYETEVRSLMGLPVDVKIETFEDTGQIFLKNAVNATELPDVDFSGVNPEQKKVALKRLNSEGCTCGCRLTLAQCRINDTSCARSKGLAAKVIREVTDAGPVPPATTAPPPANNQ
ncbi:MAG TPA: TlpA disulfide reductase family protein [Terriglobales bacterium]|jgi:thiol-disulfide isomerase/thioredoxin|nr:TlpA disulfide reductase family protein [Terriglobales bacterium]